MTNLVSGLRERAPADVIGRYSAGRIHVAEALCRDALLELRKARPWLWQQRELRLTA